MKKTTREKKELFKEKDTMRHTDKELTPELILYVRKWQS